MIATDLHFYHKMQVGLLDGVDEEDAFTCLVAS